MKTVDQRKQELVARASDLANRIQGIDAELDNHVAKDWEEMATEREDDEVLEDLGLSAQSEIRMIEAALKRVEEGEYGYCVQCGSKIAEARLDVIPATPFCRDCAAKN